MGEYRFFQIDAFAERAMAGGPAAVMPLEAFLADDVMQAIAAENNLAETAFIVAKARACGTCAGSRRRWKCRCAGMRRWRVRMRSMRILALMAPEIGFDTKSGRLTVKRLADGRLEMDFPAQPPRDVPMPEGLAEALGATPQTVVAGPYLMAIFETPDAGACAEA